MTVASAY